MAITLGNPRRPVGERLAAFRERDHLGDVENQPHAAVAEDCPARDPLNAADRVAERLRGDLLLAE